jgi:TRAP-type C4-dicarboxylate transport system substrate-binding protein
MGVIMNTRSLARLSPQDQRIVQEVVQAAMDETVQLHENMIAGTVAMIRQGGNQIYTLTDAELAEWYSAAEPFIRVWKERTNAAGFDADAMYRKYLEILKRHM